MDNLMRQRKDGCRLVHTHLGRGGPPQGEVELRQQQPQLQAQQGTPSGPSGTQAGGGTRLRGCRGEGPLHAGGGKGVGLDGA